MRSTSHWGGGDKTREDGLLGPRTLFQGDRAWSPNLHFELHRKEATGERGKVTSRNVKVLLIPEKEVQSCFGGYSCPQPCHLSHHSLCKTSHSCLRGQHGRASHANSEEGSRARCRSRRPGTLGSRMASSSLTPVHMGRVSHGWA